MVLADAVVRRIVAAAWFGMPQRPYLLLDADFRIRAVNTAYRQATGQPRLVGELMFEVFPDNPCDPTADGVAKLTASLESVLSRGRPHWMGLQRYDVPDPRESGMFLRKVWTPVNTPIGENGIAAGVLHHVQDVTAVLNTAEGCGPLRDPMAELRATADTLSGEFPAAGRDAVIAVLADSRRVVQETLGHPDHVHAGNLARLRLEALTGRPGTPAGPET